MTYRFLLYPLLMLVGVQLHFLLRQDRLWNLAPILRRVLILIVVGFAWFTPAHWLLAGLAWGLFVLFVVAPRLTLAAGTRRLMAGQLQAAARLWRCTGWFLGGRQARLYDRFAHELGDAGELEDETALAGLPEGARSEYRLWQLWRLSATRQWHRVVDFAEHAEGWATTGHLVQARLVSARALAETGQLDRAVRHLALVALSPRNTGSTETQYWVTRVMVAALAGDAKELERLLGSAAVPRYRGWARFAAVWRGRCAAVRGDRAEAGRQYSRALALTPANLTSWRKAIQGYWQDLDLPRVAPADGDYAGLRELLRDAEEQSRPWRALMSWGRPGQATLGLLSVLAVVFVVDTGWFREVPLYTWLGNLPWREMNGEWYRVATALLLHAGVIHFAMNAAALWIFGAAVEQALGGRRMLLIFWGAGIGANLLSAWRGGFDVSVGASSGLFGLVAAFGVGVYRLQGPVYAGVRRRLLGVLGVLIVADVVVGALEPQVDNVAHVGGFVGGLVLALLLTQSRRRVV